MLGMAIALRLQAWQGFVDAAKAGRFDRALALTGNPCRRRYPKTAPVEPLRALRMEGSGETEGSGALLSPLSPLGGSTLRSLACAGRAGGGDGRRQHTPRRQGCADDGRQSCRGESASLMAR
jgi:hypothetical protein